MKSVLLTGATGFIGKHAIDELLSQGFVIHAVTSKNVPNISQSVHWHQKNLLDSSQITTLIDHVRPSHLLHFAWDATPGKYWTSSSNLDWVQASLHLLQEFVKHGGKRVVIAGTCAEYNWDHGHCEEHLTPLNPSTLYGTCKASLYRILDAYAKQTNLSYAWGRFFFIYGPHEFPQRFVPNVIRSLLKKEIAKCSHGTQLRDFLHVKDVANAFATLLNSDLQGPINIASGQTLELKEIVYLIANKLEVPHLLEFAPKSHSNDAPLISASIQRLSNELNWFPKYSLDERLNQTIQWWKNES